VNGIDGLIAPSNIPMNVPDPVAHVTSITGLKFAQALSENFAVFFGKINTLDEYPLRYSPGLGTNRSGLEGFMNTSLIFNPIGARTIPYAAAGIGAAVMQDGEPLFTFTVFDPQERATRGLEDLFGLGVLLVPDLVLRGTPFGRPGVLNIGGTWSSAQYRSFDPAAYLSILSDILAGNPNKILTSPVENGSWSAYANFYQSLWVDPSDEKRTWGVFGQSGVSDGNPNPFRFVASGGIGGRSMFPGRTLDTFGAGLFFLGLSSNFKALSQPFNPQRDEYGVELFYNYAVTPWCRLTGDVQVARPTTVALDTVVIAGLRLQILL
jgi:porin